MTLDVCVVIFGKLGSLKLGSQHVMHMGGSAYKVMVRSFHEKIPLVIPRGKWKKDHI
jgi:hypothetical protein